jgi:hypothetical protein
MANQPQFGSTPMEKASAALGRASTDVKNKTEELATHFAERAKEVGANVGEKAKKATASVAGMAEDVAQRAGDMASNIGQKAEEAVSSVGGQVQSLAGTIREKAPHEGMLGSAASSVADTLDVGGRYLQEENLHGMAGDVTGLIRRYPIQAVLVGIGIGFLAARATRG